MAFGSQDVATFFIDGSDCVLADGSTIKCHLDFPEDIEMFHGQSATGVVSAKPVMTFATAAGANKVFNGATLKVDGVPYLVGAVRKQHDGLVSTAQLMRAGS